MPAYTLSPETTSLAVDSLMFATLFYVLSNWKMYDMTAKIFPGVIKDRVILHAVVYALLFVLIQKITKRV